MDSNFYFNFDSNHEPNTSVDLVILIPIPSHSDFYSYFDFGYEPNIPPVAECKRVGFGYDLTSSIYKPEKIIGAAFGFY